MLGFGLTQIVFHDMTKQYIKAENHLLLQKPKLIVTKNKSYYKIDYNILNRHIVGNVTKRDKT